MIVFDANVGAWPLSGQFSGTLIFINRYPVLVETPEGKKATIWLTLGQITHFLNGEIIHLEHDQVEFETD